MTNDRRQPRFEQHGVKRSGFQIVSELTPTPEEAEFDEITCRRLKELP